MMTTFSVRPTLGRPPEWECFDTTTGEVVASGLSNSQAWREADIKNMESISRQQQTSDWSWKQQAKGQ